MAARATGLIAAIILGVLLLLVATRSMSAEDLDVPSNGVTAGGPRDNPTDNLDPSALSSRARLQQWPGSPQPPSKPSLALGAENGKAGATGKQIVEQWLSDRDAVKDMLPEAKMRRGIATLP